MEQQQNLAKTVECVLNAQAVLGEGPIWDTRQQVLWWIDVEQHQLHRYDPATGQNTSRSVGQRIGTVVPRARGGLTVAVQHGFAHCDSETGQLQMIVDPEAALPGNRFNDGKCDPAGRLWAGTMQMAEEDMQAGSLYCLHADGTVTRKLSSVGISNGIVWSSDQRTMYYIDSPTRRVDAFDFDADTGEISNRRTAVTIPDGMGFPDGMAIDDQDRLWVALFAGWGVACFDARSGRLLGTVRVPAEQVTACAFGGPDLDQLFITTARRDIQGERLKDQPAAGGLFVAAVDARGVPATPFAG